MAWARWVEGLGPAPAQAETDEEAWPLWDIEGAYPGVTAAYCRRECSAARRAAGQHARPGDPCAQCPRPTLLPECQSAVAAYLLCETQWRYVSGMGAARSGLDMAGCRVVLEAHREALCAGETTLDSLIRDLQIIERAILSCDVERRQTEKPQGIAVEE